MGFAATSVKFDDLAVSIFRKPNAMPTIPKVSGCLWVMRPSETDIVAKNCWVSCTDLHQISIKSPVYPIESLWNPIKNHSEMILGWSKISLWNI